MKTKRTLSFILSIIMLASSLMCLPTNAFASDINPEGKVFLNPLFYDEDDVTDYDYVQAKEVLSAQPTAYSSNIVYSNPTEAAEALRDAMVDRQASIPLKFYYPKDFDDRSITGIHVLNKLLYMAWSEELSVSPVDGDYLYNSWKYYDFSNYKTSNIGDKVYCEITYGFEYMTTKEEEQILTEKINHDLPLLNLEGKSEYLKIKKIHDYICESTTSENPNNDSYDYRTTAYGALILGNCVCTGYSVSFYRLCKEVGLTPRVVSGICQVNENEVSRCWNIVRVGDLFYFVDLQWDDLSNGGYHHKWMLKGKNDFELHTLDEEYTTDEYINQHPMSDYSYVCKHSDNDELVSSAEATCTEQGYKEYYCPLCDENHKEDIVDALGHDYTTVVTEPTCNGYGYTTHTCNRCSYEFTDDRKDPLGHDYTIVVTEPTCYCYGYTTYTCNRCSYGFSDDWKESLGHDYKTVVTPPTCAEEGYTTYTCNRCGYYCYDDFVPATDKHNYYVSEKEDPTCDWGGYIKYTCSVCGGYYYEYPDALGHDYKTVVTPPTCAEEGYTTYTCNRCGDYYYDDNIPATGKHNYYVSEKENPTCDFGGYIEYTCSVCEDYYYEYPDALGHDYKTVVTPPTCAEEGYTTHTCNRCGDYYYDDFVLATDNHKYKTTTAKATLSKNGSVLTKCSVCGSTKSNTTIYYPKSISLSATSYTYDGKVKTPSVKVVGSNGKAISSSNYTVSYASGRKYVGKYAVKITFKGNYSGSKTLYFTINPKGTSISSLSSGSKKFTVKWKKQSTQTTGYQIQYSTSSKFSNAKTVTLTKNSYTSKSISKLSAKKKYYVRVRTYKKVGSTYYYSSWSKAKYVTTKK